MTKKELKDRYPNNCEYCKRIGHCEYYTRDNKKTKNGVNCEYFIPGTCLTCVYHKNGGIFTEEEYKNWVTRGCKFIFPESDKRCSKYIPYNRFTSWLYRKGILR